MAQGTSDRSARLGAKEPAENVEGPARLEWQGRLKVLMNNGGIGRATTMTMNRISRLSARPSLFVGALAISGALATLGCGASSRLSTDGAADRQTGQAADLGASELHDGGTELSRDASADAASDAPVSADAASDARVSGDAASDAAVAPSCATMGCGAPPRCGEACQSPCGCCACAEGQIALDVSGEMLRCTGGCYVDAVDGGVNGCGPTLAEPTGIGCYFSTRDCGLRKVECNGELDVTNPAATAATVEFTLTVVPSNVIPTLSGPPEVDIAFDDPDGTWATTWSAQPGNGNTFVVHTGAGNPNVGGVAPAAGMTTVRMGTGSLKLASVPLVAQQSMVVQAFMTGAVPNAVLDMEAVVTDVTGKDIQYDMGICRDEPGPQ